MRSLHRDLAVAKENLLDIEVRETERSREMRRFCLSELEHAHAEESLGRKKKKRCGCCLQLFSYVNLPLSVSHKAIIDIRKSWVSAHASNSSMNEKSPSKTRTNGDGSRQTISNAWIDEDERLSVVPRCYDEVRVCTFCAQFFHALEKYRPSFDMVAHEAKRKAALEREKREKEYWDPLKMCEKDRQEAEALEKQAAAAAAAMANSGASVTYLYCNLYFLVVRQILHVRRYIKSIFLYLKTDLYFTCLRSEFHYFISLSCFSMNFFLLAK